MLSERHPDRLAVRIVEAHGRVGAGARTTLEAARECGELLCQAKRAVGHGRWASWLDANCAGLPCRTASAYMRVAARWAELGGGAGGLGVRAALALLCGPSDMTTEKSATVADLENEVIPGAASGARAGIEETVWRGERGVGREGRAAWEPDVAPLRRPGSALALAEAVAARLAGEGLLARADGLAASLVILDALRAAGVVPAE